MRIKPCGHRVLVKLKQFEEVSQGGIIISTGEDINRQRFAMQEAVVEALGPTAFKAFDDGVPWCSVGDKVLIVKYSGEDREDPETGIIFRIVNDDDICAILEE